MPDDMKFLLWLLLISSSSPCFGSESDVQCLKTLQLSLGDPSGTLKASWDFVNGTDGFICRFVGVECWHPEESRVLSLQLGNLGLQGLFPRGLKNCSHMTGLDLSRNNLSGPIPADIARRLQYVTSLDLSYNSFSGEIPASISNMTYLNILSLQNNRFSGKIPDQINDLSRLTSIRVSDNCLSGPIPLALQRYPVSNFAGNQGLCGAPFDNICPQRKRRRRIRIRIRPHRINDESIIGAAVGFVAGLVVALYFPHGFIFCGKLRPYVFRI